MYPMSLGPTAERILAAKLSIMTVVGRGVYKGPVRAGSKEDAGSSNLSIQTQ
jgi:hypothetical protein